jgi:glutamate-1-semialdehyde 2,1-aminomutase
MRSKLRDGWPMMGRSEELFARARAVMPGGVSSPVRAFGAVGGTPNFIRSGSGARVTDVDGRVYLDYVSSWGPLILGHAHPAVVAAIEQTVRDGATFGAPTEREIELAEIIIDALPSVEMVRFVSSGTEAAMSAIRVARAATGRDKVLKFAGGYHGHSDGLLASAGSGPATLGLPDSAGVPARFAGETVIAPYNDGDQVALAFDRFGDQIACVIVEPIAANMGVVPPRPGFLEDIRAMCDAHGALLIFDEVVTGFRVGYGGAQGMLNVSPDLTVLGKIVGGGLPIGAYGGSTVLMEQVAPAGPVYQAGTLSGNPLSVAAGIATLRTLDADTYASLERRGGELQEGLEAAAQDAGVPLRIQRVGSMLTPFFTADHVHTLDDAKRTDAARYAAFFHGLLARGISTPPSAFEAWFVGMAHTSADIASTIDACRDVLKEM